MEKITIKVQALRGFALVLCAAVSMALLSCNSNTKRKEPPVPSRDCQQEYMQLSIKEFHSLNEAKKAVRDFLNEFEDNAQCSECITNVKQMETAFFGMDNLFSNIDNSLPKDRYCAFKSMVNSNGFSGTPYETVRLTWNYLVEDKKETYIKDRLEAIDENDFKPRLMKYAREIAEQAWGNRFDVMDCEVYGEVEVSIVDGKMAKCGTCNKVGVYMEGNFLPKGRGKRFRERFRKRATVYFKVGGTLKLSESNCEMVFDRGDFDYLGYIGDDPGRPVRPINVNVHVGRR
ncbi:MAG: hypothetical protein IJK78_00230 [Bacteroidales bacterium]|nr:hypothetical protein [Bacteroidales bacterium]